MRLLLRRFHLAGALYLLALLGAAIAGSKYLQGDGSTIIVTSTADSGPGSLRQAFADANDGDTIQFDLTLNGQTITLTSAELAIDKNITVSGPGPGLLTVSRNQQAPNFRIFHTLPGHTVVVSGLTITGGRVGADGGAGVMNDQANLTINNCTISENTFASSQSGGGNGGGIRNRGGTLNLVNSTVSANGVRLAQGGSLVEGGGVGSSGALTVTNITNSVISGNSSDFNGGGIVNNGRLTITDSVVSSNQAGLFFSHTNGLGGGIYNGSSGILTIRNSVVSSNITSGDSSSGIGGGICSQWSLAISDSTISGNSATRVGGGIYGYATITNCTISGNVTQGQGGGIFGGGIITNCTISGNASQFQGGGIYGGGNITSSTIAGNTANQGGGIYATNGVQLGHTILKAGSLGANIVNNGSSVTSLGYNLSSDNGGGFLVAPGDQINTDPLLGPLQDNGGPTFTHLPLNGSPAIDAGNPNFTQPPLNDQRGYGYVRVYNGRIDIGSLEVQPAPTLSPTPTATATATFAPSATPCSSLLTQSSTQTITTGNSVSCNNGNGNTNNSYWRAFNMAALTGGASYNVSSVSFGVESVTHPASVTVRLYTTSNFPTAFLTQIGTTSLNVSLAQNGTVVTAPLLANVPAGTPQLVMELFTPDGQTTGTLFYVGSNADPETAPSYLSAAVCGLSTPAPLAAIGFPDMHIVFNVNGSCGGTPAPTATSTATATATFTPTTTPIPTPTPTPCPIFNISGAVGQCTTAGPSGIALPGVTMTLTRTGQSTSTTTDGSGNYFLSGFSCVTNTLTPSKVALTPGSAGIDTVDVITLQKHFLIIGPPISQCRLTAADCAPPAGVSTVDVLATQKFFLQLAGSANVGKYSFTPASRSYSPPIRNQTAQNYDTIVFGDVAPPYAAP